MPVVGTSSNYYQSKMARLFETAIMPHIQGLSQGGGGQRGKLPPLEIFSVNTSLQTKIIIV